MIRRITNCLPQRKNEPTSRIQMTLCHAESVVQTASNVFTAHRRVKTMLFQTHAPSAGTMRYFARLRVTEFARLFRLCFFQTRLAHEPGANNVIFLDLSPQFSTTKKATVLPIGLTVIFALTRAQFQICATISSRLNSKKAANCFIPDRFLQELGCHVLRGHTRGASQ